MKNALSPLGSSIPLLPVTGDARKSTLVKRWVSGSPWPPKLVLTSQLWPWQHVNLYFCQSQQSVIFRGTVLPMELQESDRAGTSVCFSLVNLSFVSLIYRAPAEELEKKGYFPPLQFRPKKVAHMFSIFAS